MIIDPRVNDHLRPGVIAEEQSEPSADPGTPPMAVARAERAALAVLVPGWLLRDDFQHQPAQRVEQLDVRIRCEPGLIASLRALDRAVELAQLVDGAIVEQQRPSVALHQRSTSPSMSSSGGGCGLDARRRTSHLELDGQGLDNAHRSKLPVDIDKRLAVLGARARLAWAYGFLPNFCLQ